MGTDPCTRWSPGTKRSGGSNGAYGTRQTWVASVAPVAFRADGISTAVAGFSWGALSSVGAAGASGSRVTWKTGYSLGSIGSVAAVQAGRSSRTGVTCATLNKV